MFHSPLERVYSCADVCKRCGALCPTLWLPAVWVRHFHLYIHDALYAFFAVFFVFVFVGAIMHPRRDIPTTPLRFRRIKSVLSFVTPFTYALFCGSSVSFSASFVVQVVVPVVVVVIIIIPRSCYFRCSFTPRCCFASDDLLTLVLRVV